MADLTQHAQLPTVQSLFRKYEERGQSHRPHLGASQIGHSCDRYLWYQFRWAASPSFDGRMLRLFDHGDSEEARFVRDLRAAGFTIYDVDRQTGKQFNFTACGGHFGCSLDGAGKGFPESPRWHLLEFKTMNAKQFGILKSKGLKDAKPQYWAQVIVGMELSGLERTMHLTICKDNDEVYGERIHASTSEANRLLERAERVIFSESPLERVSERPDWYECKWCDMQDACHHGARPEVNCRTCAHSTPERDGTWSCDRHDCTLSVQDQRAGCDRHIFRPDMMAEAAVDAGTDWVDYGGWFNHCDGATAGRHCYTSQEIAASDVMPLEEGAEDIRQTFGGVVGSNEKVSDDD
jgi:hypothetical protein